MKIMPVLLATILLNACAIAPRPPVLNAENKKVVFINDIDMIWQMKKPEDIDIGTKIFNTVSQLKFGGMFYAPPIASYTPGEMRIKWSDMEDKILYAQENMTLIPYSPELEEKLMAGYWVYYHPEATDRSKIFVPCPTHCGPAGTPTLAGLKNRASYLVKREYEKDRREYLRIGMERIGKNTSGEIWQRNRAFYGRKAAREEKLRKELERITIEYNRTHK